MYYVACVDGLSGDHRRMTTRVYLQAVQLAPGPPAEGDLPAERVFIHASDPAEIWVETESATIPERGRSVSFALAKTLGIGFERISGTVERALDKRTRRTSGRS